MEFQITGLAKHVTEQPNAEKSKDNNNETKMSKARVALERRHLAQTIGALDTLMQ